MAKSKSSPPPPSPKSRRNFPQHTLEESLAVPQKITDEMPGKVFKRILLADALGYSPSSSNFRDLLSSSYKYGLTEGTEKATEISLTKRGEDVSQTVDPQRRLRTLREAAFAPDVFKRFYESYSDRKIPNMMNRILVSEYGVPEEYVEECSRIIIENGRFTGIIREVSGSPHVLLDADLQATAPEKEEEVAEDKVEEQTTDLAPEPQTPTPSPVIPQTQTTSELPKAIFIGHGKNKEPLHKLQRILTSFQIPHKVTIDEANLGRPIP